MRLYTETEVADLLHVDIDTVALWRRRYGWPHVKLGRQIRFTEANILAIQAQHSVKGETVEGLPGQTSRSARRSA